MPIITTAAITILLKSLAQKGIEKIVETGAENISSDAYSWLKNLFYKDNEPKKILKELRNNPADTDLLGNASAIINNSLEDNPLFEKYLEEIIKKAGAEKGSISNSKNVVTGNVSTGGGHFVNGDNNNIS
ncbi:hypothetical protein [Flavobacterium collinsii]|uniref:Eukaryotic translation initiation factor 3 110 kDa subunit n=1 Tax=Flavobacterium collinsii TaxID=1114861 RepID=A0A9W4XGC9_9FLAO|nr:hypothetical protein [Flavobacterium collinsii]CAI2769133.1 Eukaryotic translation initiation factor 3 110 kDa subunit [Flavobacterium collinsii]